MDTLKKIPVLGYLIRVVVAIAKLPKHFDFFYSTLQRLQEENNVQRQSLEELSIELQQTIDRYSEESKRNSECHEEMERLIRELQSWNMERLNEIKELFRIVQDVGELNLTEEAIKKLNVLTSIHPTIWGDQDRLDISELATVQMCTFNTNSGRIKVGDYTFAGMGVSILAGSHDVSLTGLLRRDVDLTEGCDIVIGKGVWLASNSTILGPATIGDNAVIAAGAVVAPGTEVPANTIYGGIPAKEIARIDVVNDIDLNNTHIQGALKRCQNMLFAEGWSEKCLEVIDEKRYIGHYLVADDARMILDQNQFDLFYLNEGDGNELKIHVRGDEMACVSVPLPGRCGEVGIDLAPVIGVEAGEFLDLVINKKKPNEKLFISLKK